MPFDRFLRSLAFICCVIPLPAAAQNCSTVDAEIALSICMEGTSWAQNEADAGGRTFFNAELGYAASLTVHQGGSADGVTAGRAAELIIRAEATEATGFTILGQGRMPSGNVVYTATAVVDGQAFVWVNTISVGPGKTVQVTTWRTGNTVTDADREAHLSFGRLLQTGTP